MRQVQIRDALITSGDNPHALGTGPGSCTDAGNHFLDDAFTTKPTSWAPSGMSLMSVTCTVTCHYRRRATPDLARQVQIHSALIISGDNPDVVCTGPGVWTDLSHLPARLFGHCIGSDDAGSLSQHLGCPPECH
mmetsp:Transcript_102773/g.229551  ORF Transcript_102773/g.229551 Transcript_102773/m.229551 type:complete len:134 (+) Transcript_102773:242-643(+)